MKRLLPFLSLLLAGTAYAAVSFEWHVTLNRSGLSQGVSRAQTLEEAWTLCEGRIPTTRATRTEYRCELPRLVAIVTPDTTPTPTPINCEVGAWGACTAGTQTRTVTRQPANGGTACPALTQSCTITPPVDPPPTGNETVGTWAQRTFSRPFRINMEPGSYPGPWVTMGATHQNLAGAWDGGRVARLTPTTSEGYSAIGAFDLPNTRALSVRFELRTGPTWASGSIGMRDLKFLIVQTRAGQRPMMNFAPAGRCAIMAVGASTVKQFNQTTTSPDYFNSTNLNKVYWCDRTSDAPSGKRVVLPGEWVSITFHVVSGTSIRGILTDRTGATLADWQIPWNYDSNWGRNPTDIYELQVLGGYWNGSGNREAGTYIDIAGVTFEVGNNTPLRPRSGFIQ